jgi:DNA-binding NarL/FixJ family response regulator
VGVKILTCEDHELFREGLKRVLRQLDAEAELLEAGNAAEAQQLADAHGDLDLLLLDLGLPDSDGLALLRRLRESHPLLSIVVISASEDPREVSRALDAGAAGFIPKSSDRASLVRALEVVFAGGVFFPREALEAARRAPAAPRLTRRQHEVAALITKGLTNKEIASALEISTGTVKAHVASLLETLDVSNRTEAVRVLVDLGLIEPEKI